MYNFTRITRLFVIFALCLQITQPVIARRNYWAQWAKTCVATGASLIAVGGIIGLTNYILHEDDERLIGRIQHNIDVIHEEHMPQVYALLDIFNTRTINEHERKRILNDTCETAVYDIHTHIYKQKKNISAYLQSVLQAISNLEQDKQKINQHIIIAQREGESADHIAPLNQLAKRIDEVVPYLSILYDYFMRHKAYTKLYTLEVRLAKAYRKELDSIQNNTRNADALINYLYNRNHHENAEELITTYLEKIRTDIQRLEQCIPATQKKYQHRAQWARELHNSLIKIQRIVEQSRPKKQPVWPTYESPSYPQQPKQSTMNHTPTPYKNVPYGNIPYGNEYNEYPVELHLKGTIKHP